AVEGEPPRQLKRRLGSLQDKLLPAAQLHRPAVHEVYARDDHSRTLTPEASRTRFACRIEMLPSWKIDAASAASASPSERTRAMSWGVPAPPEAMTGTWTARDTARVSSIS